MLLSMNVFDHQTTRPKFLHFPSSCHGRRIPHKPPVLVSFPAKTEFNLKFLHSASKSVLVSYPATKKFRPVLFALPRDNEEFSSDNEEEEEPINQEPEKEHGGALILSDNGEYVVREAELEEEFWASAMLKAEGLYEYRSHNRSVSSYEKKEYSDVEFDVIMKRYTMRYIEPFMCIIAVRKEGETVLENVIGTLDFRVKYLLQGETYPEELVKRGNPYSTFKKRGSEKCGIITNVTVAESARQQGVGSSMLKFAIEAAKEEGIRRGDSSAGRTEPILVQHKSVVRFNSFFKTNKGFIKKEASQFSVSTTFVKKLCAAELFYRRFS
ncbi:hypothetical protein MKW98_001799 [Papaver atlanticum]|uniref:N-acetyltransferase domain-containing protein n=1 Tax=Papaver atlanticum TaxID=357466 RepID=A0AAD4SBE2_9MAGN|nr:hypothetical protein MKW98_001799 [Papaver atlanticum]